MKLIFPLLKQQLDLSLDDKINILVIENQSYFLHFLTQLWNGLQKDNCDVVLSSEHVPLDISKKLEMINTFVPFDINKKNLLTKLYQKAQNLMMSEDFYVLTQEIIQKNINFICQITQNLPFSIDCSPDFDVSYLMKAVDMKFDSDYESIAEKVIDYMETVNLLEGEKCFVLVNLRNYIDDVNIDVFYKNVLYKKLKVLVVSAHDYDLSIYEKKTIIDRDLCVI